MSTIKISALPTASGIDGAADYLPIVQSSVTNKISRNTLLGLASAPLGISDSQSISNKTIGNTNSITIKDGSFTLQNTSDATKQAVFSLSGITTGNTRTITIPDASLTMVGTATTQTLTNKTLTSPTITGGTYDNGTITVDSIAGHTSGTIVTVANMQISNGVLNSANAVTAVSIAAGAVQPQALQSGTGSGWSWQSWSPTPTNYSVGNGTVISKYIQIGKTVFVKFVFTLGSTSSVIGSVSFTLPVTAVSTSAVLPDGLAQYTISTSQFLGWAYLASTTSASLYYMGVSSSLIVANTLDATHPGSFGAASVIATQFQYEAA